MRYDAAGNECEPEDVLDAEELGQYRAAQRDRRPSSRRPHHGIFPVLDEDGYDSEGWTWGARTYGDAS